jgi:hypothetical protein
MKFSKKADLKEYSNEATKGINDFIIQHPKVMSVVIDAAKRATDEKSFTDWLQEALTGEGMEEGVRKEVKWEELGWAWFNTVNRETTEPTSTDIIEQLPTLDKPKKIDELLEQLSIETNPAKKEQIKQHIERIKRAKLLKADVLGDPIFPIQPAIDRGQREVSLFDPEYEFLVKLIKLISKASPEAIPEIKALSRPFHTIDDVGDLTAKIWTLATTKYNIPRNWLIKQLPEKKGSLKEAYDLNESPDVSDAYDIPEPAKPEMTEEEFSQIIEQAKEGARKQFPRTAAIRLAVLDNMLNPVMSGSDLARKFNVHTSEIFVYKRYFSTIFKRFAQSKGYDIPSSFKTADLWPAQEETENMLTQSPGAIAFNNPKDTTVCGPNPNDVANEDALWDIVVNEFLTAHKRWSDVVKAIRLAHSEVTDSVILSLKDRVRKSLDTQMGMVGSKKVAYHAINDLTQFALDDKEIRQHFKNRGTTVEDVIASLPNFKIEHTPRELEQKDPSLKDTTKGFYDYTSGTLYINPRISLDAKRITIIHEIEHAIQDSIGELPVHTPEDIYKVRQTPYEERTFELGAKQQQFNALRQRGMGLVEITNYWMKRYGYGEYERQGLTNELELLNGIYEEMMPESVMASKKIAALGYGLWMNPQGEMIDVASHPDYAFDNAKELGLQNIPEKITDENVGEVWDSLFNQLFEKGWVRLRRTSNEIVVQLNDLQNIPDAVNDFIIEHPAKIVSLEEGMSGEYLRIDYNEVIEKGIQQAVKENSNQPVNASLKQAKHHLNMDQVIKILDSKDSNKVDHIDFTTNEVELLSGERISFDEATKRAVELDKTAEGEFTGAEFSTDAVGVNPSMDSGPFSSPQDQGAGKQKKPFPNTMWDVATDDEDESQPYSNIASSKKAFCKKEANPSTRYWIAPDGTEFDAGTHHGAWIKQNKQILKQYDIPFTTLGMVWAKMIQSGWVRVSNEKAGAGFQIQVQDLKAIPGFVDDFIARNFKDGDVIEMGDQNGNLLKITDPFPSIQKAVSKALRNPVNASLKQADINGHFINDILKSIESTGGVTYNLSKGNLAGTNNYSVSVYPEKEKIVSLVDFEEIENYIDSNEDLLSDPNNSFGAWVNGSQVYLDIVVTIPDKQKALNLARTHNQLAIYDLAQGKEIPTGIVRAFSKQDIVKKAEESPLTEEQANQISAASCPAYVIAINNYYEAVKRGHDKQKSIDYAIFSTKNLEQIDEKRLVEFINTYLGPVK